MRIKEGWLRQMGRRRVCVWTLPVLLHYDHAMMKAICGVLAAVVF